MTKDKKIISKKYAKKLVRQGKARIEGGVMADYPNSTEITHYAVSRFDTGSTVHFLA